MTNIYVSALQRPLDRPDNAIQVDDVCIDHFDRNGSKLLEWTSREVIADGGDATFRRNPKSWR